MPQRKQSNSFNNSHFKDPSKIHPTNCCLEYLGLLKSLSTFIHFSQGKYVNSIFSFRNRSPRQLQEGCLCCRRASTGHHGLARTRWPVHQHTLTSDRMVRWYVRALEGWIDETTGKLTHRTGFFKMECESHLPNRNLPKELWWKFKTLQCKKLIIWVKVLQHAW